MCYTQLTFTQRWIYLSLSYQILVGQNSDVSNLYNVSADRHDDDKWNKKRIISFFFIRCCFSEQRCKKAIRIQTSFVISAVRNKENEQNETKKNIIRP